jgi:hypothetical protein
MARSRCSGVLSTALSYVFGLYFAIALMGFVPYYNWQYAKENGFVSWLLLGEVVATARAMAWPYFVLSGADDSGSASLHHLARSIELRNEAVSVGEEEGPGLVAYEDMEEMIGLMREALAEGELVDVEVLDREYDGFASHFQDEYLQGLRLFLESWDEDDYVVGTLKSLESQSLQNKWGDWYEANVLKGSGRGSLLPGPEATLQSSAARQPFNADELDRYSRILAKFDKQAVTDSDLAEMRSIMEGYTRRTGGWMTRGEYELSIGLMETIGEYQYELGQSILMSWDRKERFTTSRYEEIRRLIAGLGLRTPELLATDQACLEAAARNQYYIEDEEGNMYEFGRDTIVQKVRENELFKANWERVAGIVEEFVR